MKKAFSAFLAAAVIALGLPLAASADAAPQYAFGGDTAVSGQDGSAQGQNGWYYMWTPETNKAGVYDVSKIKEDVASETGSCQFGYGSGLVVDGSKGWLPDIFAADGYDPWGSNNWWLQMPDGTCNPAVAGGTQIASAVFGFKAPQSGEYVFDMSCFAGAHEPGDDASSDGVTISIYSTAGKLFSKATSKTAEETIDATVGAMLKAGDMLYFIADPNANGGYDTAKFAITGNKVGDYIDNVTTFKFGTTSIFGQDGSAQGQNGWYYMWSPETNKAGAYDVSKIKADVASETGSCQFGYGSGLVVDGTMGWLPDIFAADGYDPWGSNNWWLQMPDGTCNPAVAGGTQIASAVFGFKAPQSGEYVFDMSCFAGAHEPGDDASSDGVTISIYSTAGKLFSQASSKTEKETIQKSVSVTLKAGDMVYFIADPNANGGYDTANFQVKATITKLAVETPVSSSGNSSTPSQTSPKTGGSAVPVAVLAALLLSGAAFVTVRKARGC